MMLTVAGIAAAAAVLNAVLPALSRSSGAVVTASAKVDERLNRDIAIVHVIGELDSTSGVSNRSEMISMRISELHHVATRSS